MRQTDHQALVLWQHTLLLLHPTRIQYFLLITTAWVTKEIVFTQQYHCSQTAAIGSQFCCTCNKDVDTLSVLIAEITAIAYEQLVIRTASLLCPAEKVTHWSHTWSAIDQVLTDFRWNMCCATWHGTAVFHWRTSEATFRSVSHGDSVLVKYYALTCSGDLAKSLEPSFRKGVRTGLFFQRLVKIMPGCTLKACMLVPWVLQVRSNMLYQWALACCLSLQMMPR